MAVVAAAEMFAASAAVRYPDMAIGELRAEMGRVLAFAYVCVQDYADDTSSDRLKPLAVGAVLGRAL